MMNWRTTPSVRLLIPFCLGINIAVVLQLSLLLVTSLSTLFFVCSLLWYFKDKGNFKRRWLHGVLISLLAFGLGHWAVYRHDESNADNHYAHFITNSNEANQLVVKIDELPDNSGKNIKLIGEVLSANAKVACGHILLYVQNDSLTKSLDYGDIIAINAQLNPIQAPQNPYSFDYQNYMKLRNVKYSAFVKSSESTFLSSQNGNPVMHFAYDSQHHLIDILSNYLPEAAEFSVGSALILGNRSEISDDIINAYVNTGAMHVLSVSGLHVGLVATLFGWIIKKSKYKIKLNPKFWQIAEPLLQILFIWLFALITGASSCVLRSAVMFTFVVVGKSFGRSASIYNSLSVSALVLLAYNPYFLFDVSFQLSYIGLLGISFFYHYVYRFGKQSMLIREKSWADKIWELVSVSIAAMITTTPLSLYYFHQFPPYFWLSGIFVVPLATVVLYVGLLLFAMSWWTSFAWLLGRVLFYTIWLMNEILFWIEQMPPHVVRDLWVNAFGVLLWYLLVFFLAIFLVKKRHLWLNYSLAVLCLIVAQYVFLEYLSHKQSLIVFYDTPKAALVDIIHREQAFCIHSDGINSRSIDFASRSNRMKHRCAAHEVTHLTIKDSLNNEILKLKNGLCQYKDKVILFLDNENKEDFATSEKIKLDYLVLQDSPFMDFEKITQQFDIQQVIALGNNKTNSTKFYQQQCKERNIAYHDVRKQGAFVVEIER